MKHWAIAALLLVLPFSARATGLDIALSDETAYVSIIFDGDPVYPQYQDPRARRDGGSEFQLGGFRNEAGDSLLHATLLARGYRTVNQSSYHISAGVKLVGGDIEISNDIAPADESETVGALALGFQAGLVLMPHPYNPVELSFEGFLAPSITSFSEAEQFTEFSARLQIDITSRARAYVGYRRLQFDTDEFEDITQDRSAHFGLSLSFN